MTVTMTGSGSIAAIDFAPTVTRFGDAAVGAAVVAACAAAEAERTRALTDGLASLRRTP